MKISYIIVLVLFFVGSWERSYGQNIDRLSRETKSMLLTIDSLDKKLKILEKETDIEIKCLAIQKNKKLKEVVIDDAEDFLGHNPDNGASLTGYFKGNDLVRIDEWVGLSNRIIQDKYYFDKGKVIYVISVDSISEYNETTQSFDFVKLKFSSSAQYYFENEKMFAKDATETPRSLQEKDEERELLTRAKEYKKLLEEKRKTNHKL